MQDILEDSTLPGYDTVSIGSYRRFEEVHLLRLQGSVSPRRTFVEKAILLGTGNLTAKMETAVRIDA